MNKRLKFGNIYIQINKNINLALVPPAITFLRKNAQYLENKGISITLSNGVSSQKISQIFTKEELLKRVIEARD